jgi:hypothetical protein
MWGYIYIMKSHIYLTPRNLEKGGNRKSEGQMDDIRREIHVYIIFCFYCTVSHCICFGAAFYFSKQMLLRFSLIHYFYQLLL